MPIPIQTTNGITKISRSTPVTSTAFAARRLAKQTTLPKERSKAPCANKKESPSPPMINSTDCEKIVFRLYALNSSPLDATPNTATTRIKLTQGKTLTSSFVLSFDWILHLRPSSDHAADELIFIDLGAARNFLHNLMILHNQDSVTHSNQFRQFF